MNEENKFDFLDMQISAFLRSISSGAICFFALPFIANKQYQFHFDAKIAFLLLMAGSSTYLHYLVSKKNQLTELKINQLLLYFIQGILLICVFYVPFLLNQKGFIEEIYVELGLGTLYFFWGIYLESTLKLKFLIDEIKDLPEFEQQRRIEEKKYVLGFKLFK